MTQAEMDTHLLLSVSLLGVCSMATCMNRLDTGFWVTRMPKDPHDRRTGRFICRDCYRSATAGGFEYGGAFLVTLHRQTMIVP